MQRKEEYTENDEQIEQREENPFDEAANKTLGSNCNLPCHEMSHDEKKNGPDQCNENKNGECKGKINENRNAECKGKINENKIEECNGTNRIKTIRQLSAEVVSMKVNDCSPFISRSLSKPSG